MYWKPNRSSLEYVTLRLCYWGKIGYIWKSLHYLVVVRSTWWKFGVMFRKIPNFTKIFQILTHSAPLRWRFYRFFIHTQSSRGNVRTTKGSHRCLSASLKGYPRAQWEIFTPIGGFVFFSPFHGQKAKRKASLASNHAGRKMFFQPSDWPAHQPNHHPKPQGWMDEHKAIGVFFFFYQPTVYFLLSGMNRNTMLRTHLFPARHQSVILYQQ